MFQPTPPQEGATQLAQIPVGLLAFQPTPPQEGATRAHSHLTGPSAVSTHAPTRGGDSALRCRMRYSCMFQSTPPHEGATLKATRGRCASSCFNPRPHTRGRPGARTELAE